jgi:U3 small nucleolar RNA-associated protein 15
MAVVAGPRVSLYGGSQTSSLLRALARPTKANKQQQEFTLFGEKDGSVKPDRNLSTGGYPAFHASYHVDGRLIAMGCDEGLIKICDTTSRATLRTFSTSGKKGNSKSGYPIRSVGWISDDSKLTKSSSTQSANKKLIWSAGDDAILRIWDLTGAVGTGGIGDASHPVAVMKGHGDSIRSCVYVSNLNSTTNHQENNSSSFLISGSYDHTIRVWDLQNLSSTTSQDNIDGNTHRCTSIMNHGCPVECLLAIYPKSHIHTTPLIMSAGGTTIKLWNPLTGACISTIQTKHSKTITSLCSLSIIRGEDDTQITSDDSNPSSRKVVAHRLMSAGLDGLIRIYSLDGFFTNNNHNDDTETKHKKSPPSSINIPYLHGVKTPHPITTLTMSPDCTKLAIGTSTGLVTIRQRSKYVPQGFKRKQDERSKPQPGTYSYFMRGANAQADADDHLVILQKKQKLHKYDLKLKQFRYGDALDEALDNRDPRGIAAVLEELGRRRGLIQALSNRDEETLEMILAFTVGFISNPKYTPLLIGVANILCDIYADVLGQSDTIDEYFEKLHMHVRNECRAQKSLLQLVGQIDAVMYAAEVQNSEE